MNGSNGYPTQGWCYVILAFVLGLTLQNAGIVQAQELDWATRAGGVALDEGFGIAVDGAGNSYVTGNFTGPATFGAGEPKETTLIPPGGIFVAKYTASGALIWATRAGGGSGNVGGGIAVDGAGNSYVTGIFRGSATFGAGEPNETTLTAAGGIFSSDIFVAKYTTSGVLVWATRAGWLNQDMGLGIAVDGAGNSYVTGQINGPATFGAGEPNQTTLAAADDDIFVAKYTTNGALDWATLAGGVNSDGGNGIAVDGAGNSYVTGNFTGPATFGAGEPKETTLIPAGGIFVAKYDPGGALVWATRAGGSKFDHGFAIAIDGAGNSYVTGTFTGSATFGFEESNQTTVDSAGGFDFFVAKYTASGALVWAKRAGGVSNAVGESIAVDGVGNSYVTGDFGSFTGSATFGAGEPNETTLIAAGTGVTIAGDIFVAKYTASGALVWATRAGGVSLETGHGIAVDGAGNSYVTGNFQRLAIFGHGEPNETTLIVAGNDDIFVAKFSEAGGTSNQAPNGVITTPSQTITAGASVTFTGTATDPDTPTPFTHLWTFGNGSGIPNASAANPGARTFNTEGTFTVTYRVTDGAGLADPTPATITIRVTPINQGATLTATFQGKGFCDDGAGGAEPDNETVPATVVIDFDNFPEITLTISGNFPTAVLEGFAFAKNAKGGVFGVQADGVILNGNYKSKNGQVTSLKGSFREVFDDGVEQCVSVGKFQAK